VVAKVTASEFALLADYVQDVCGIVLEPKKTYLVESRLGPLLEPLGCKNYGDLYRKARADRSGSVREQVVDAITTQETSFFRDGKPFDLMLFKLLPEHFEQVDCKRVRIWCCAASTGQEIYSLTMILKELLDKLGEYDARIIGTDISDAALAVASRARYRRVELARGLSARRLKQYFVKDGDEWQIADELRGLVSFRKLNLLQPLVGMGKFDFIFCRNVAIYFTRADREALFARVLAQLKPTGKLIIGATESLVGINDRVNRCEWRNSVYYEPRANGR
jgi:chemotaxis protein methyltransferase CheR